MEAFGLHAKKKNHVGVFQGFLDASYAPDVCARRADFFQLLRYPHGRAAEGKAAAEFAQEVDVRARHAAVQDVSEDRDVETFDHTLAIANRQGVEQTLRGV